MAGKPGIGKIITLAAIVSNFTALGVGLYLTHAATLGFHPKLITEEEEFEKVSEIVKEMESDVILFKMDDFTVNLNGHPTRTIRVALNLELMEASGFEEVVNMGAGTRDSIVKILNGKNFKDIETIQGKLFLKDQIATTVNSYLREGVVKEVYFTQFVVQ